MSNIRLLNYNSSHIPTHLVKHLFLYIEIDDCRESFYWLSSRHLDPDVIILQALLKIVKKKRNDFCLCRAIIENRTNEGFKNKFFKIHILVQTFIVLN